MSKLCYYSEDDVKTRAYFMWMQSYGHDDNDRYYQAQKMSKRLTSEYCREIKSCDSSICRFCHCRNATILPPYLPNIAVCWCCYINKTKEQLKKSYLDNGNSSFNYKITSKCHHMSPYTKQKPIKSIIKLSDKLESLQTKKQVSFASIPYYANNFKGFFK